MLSSSDSISSRNMEKSGESPLAGIGGRLTGDNPSASAPIAAAVGAVFNGVEEVAEEGVEVVAAEDAISVDESIPEDVVFS